MVWYTGQFYALFYLQTILKVNVKQANIIVAIALALRDAIFHGVWRALRSHWPQVADDGRVPAGDRDVHSDLQGHAGRGGKQH